MIARDILTAEEFERYNEGWRNFPRKYAPQTSYNVHSGTPVIGMVYRFEDKPVFRAHVFGRRLQRFDPYFVAEEYVMPFWHAQHFVMVGEQMYTASSKLVIGDQYHRQMAKEIPVEFNWRKPLFFDDNISVELIREELGKVRGYEKQAGYFTFYSDKTGRVLSRMSALSFWQPRSYVKCIERLKEGDHEVVERLIRQIEMQAVNLSRLRKPRRLDVTKDCLISELREGRIPEDELHDFFSLWDKG